MFGIHIPSISDVKNAVTGAASSALHTTEDLGQSAVSHAASLGRSGLDLGRSAVTAVDHGVQKAGSAAISGIGKAESYADKGIQAGVMKAGQGVHAAADYARGHITGNDPLSRLARGAITGTEDLTRFDIGVVGGVGKAAVGLVGSVGQLSVMGVEYQTSPSARAAIDDKVAGMVEHGASAALGYADSVAHDPSRLLGDAAHLGVAAAGWAKGEVHSAEAAIKAGHGPESFGMTAGNLATYLIPVGGEVRAAAGVGEVATRGLVEAATRDGADAAARTGGDLAASGAAHAGADATRAIPAISDIARAGIPKAAERTGLSDAQITKILETPKGARPPTETYLSQGYERAHLAMWNDGAVRLTSRSKFLAKGTLGPDGGFTIPARRFADVLSKTGGDLRAMETQLGLTSGTLRDADTMVVEIRPEDMHDLRMPSGNELGANENWLPGGFTSGGVPEAAMDFPPGTPYEEIHLGG